MISIRFMCPEHPDPDSYRDRDELAQPCEHQHLKHTHCPAVLTENLFMDTERDCRFIMSDQGRDAIAKLHLEGILKM